MPRKTIRPKLPDDPRGATEQRILEDDLALNAFNELTQKWGVNREELMRLLLAIPHCSNKVMPLVEGMGDVAVRKLPGRIRRWAAILEKVNASVCLRPDALVDYASHVGNPEGFPKPLDAILTSKWAGPTAALLHKVPVELRFFAAYLEARIKVFHPTGARRREYGYKQIRLQTYLTVELLKLVRDSGHGPRYKQVGMLLNRAYDVAGKVRNISEDDLSKLERNNLWFQFLIQQSSLRKKERQGTGTLP